MGHNGPKGTMVKLDLLKKVETLKLHASMVI